MSGQSRSTARGLRTEERRNRSTRGPDSTPYRRTMMALVRSTLRPMSTHSARQDWSAIASWLTAPTNPGERAYELLGGLVPEDPRNPTELLVLALLAVTANYRKPLGDDSHARGLRALASDRFAQRGRYQASNAANGTPCAVARRVVVRTPSRTAPKSGGHRRAGFRFRTNCGWLCGNRRGSCSTTLAHRGLHPSSVRLRRTRRLGGLLDSAACVRRVRYQTRKRSCTETADPHQWPC